MTSQEDKALAFKSLHEADGIFVMPNAWDAGSAKFLEAAGFQAIATTSGGVNWSRGRRDWVLEIPRDEMLDAYGDIAMAVAVGEVWTNAIQPLYAVPVLAIAGLHIRDIMGYSVIALMVNGAIYLVALLLF